MKDVFPLFVNDTSTLCEYVVEEAFLGFLYSIDSCLVVDVGFIFVDVYKFGFFLNRWFGKSDKDFI